jgi:hypothetical protein
MTAQILAVPESDLAARDDRRAPRPRTSKARSQVSTGTLREIVAAVADTRPGVVLLGLGTGRRERARGARPARCRRRRALAAAS